MWGQDEAGSPSSGMRAMSEVVLFGSLPVDRTQELRQAGFATPNTAEFADRPRDQQEEPIMRRCSTNVRQSQHNMSFLALSSDCASGSVGEVRGARLLVSDSHLSPRARYAARSRILCMSSGERHTCPSAASAIA